MSELTTSQLIKVLMGAFVVVVVIVGMFLALGGNIDFFEGFPGFDQSDKSQTKTIGESGEFLGCTEKNIDPPVGAYYYERRASDGKIYYYEKTKANEWILKQGTSKTEVDASSEQIITNPGTYFINTVTTAWKECKREANDIIEENGIKGETEDEEEKSYKLYSISVETNSEGNLVVITNSEENCDSVKYTIYRKSPKTRIFEELTLEQVNLVINRLPATNDEYSILAYCYDNNGEKVAQGGIFSGGGISSDDFKVKKVIGESGDLKGLGFLPVETCESCNDNWACGFDECNQINLLWYYFGYECNFRDIRGTNLCETEEISEDIGQETEEFLGCTEKNIDPPVGAYYYERRGGGEIIYYYEKISSSQWIVKQGTTKIEIQSSSDQSSPFTESSYIKGIWKTCKRETGDIIEENGIKGETGQESENINEPSRDCENCWTGLFDTCKDTECNEISSEWEPLGYKCVWTKRTLNYNLCKKIKI